MRARNGTTHRLEEAVGLHDLSVRDVSSPLPFGLHGSSGDSFPHLLHMTSLTGTRRATRHMVFSTAAGSTVLLAVIGAVHYDLGYVS